MRLADGGHAGMTRHGRPWIRHNSFRSEALVPGTNVALLSRPEKMPGPSWSLPAGPSCPGKVVGPGTICGVCYAEDGRYTKGSIVRAQQARFAWARRCMKTLEGREEFVATMVAALVEIKRPQWHYMRVHDAGDLFNPEYTRCWARICQALPHMRFWFPTRSWRLSWVSEIVALNALPNVTVRPSALNFGDPAPVIPGLAAGTTVLTTGYNCPSVRQDNTCGPCRACWDRPEAVTSYHAITPGSRRQKRNVPASVTRL